MIPKIKGTKPTEGKYLNSSERHKSCLKKMEGSTIVYYNNQTL